MFQSWCGYKNFLRPLSDFSLSKYSEFTTFVYIPYGRGARNLRGVSLLCSNLEINLKLSSRAPFWPMVRSSSQLHNNPSSEQAVDF